jgi:hypothetical protein
MGGVRGGCACSFASLFLAQFAEEQVRAHFAAGLAGAAAVAGGDAGPVIEGVRVVRDSSTQVEAALRRGVGVAQAQGPYQSLPCAG